MYSNTFPLRKTTISQEKQIFTEKADALCTRNLHHLILFTIRIGKHNLIIKIIYSERNLFMSDCNQRDYKCMGSMAGTSGRMSCSNNNGSGCRNYQSMNPRNRNQNRNVCDKDATCSQCSQCNQRNNTRSEGNMHCHQMNEDIDNMPIAMGYVPWQHWKCIYEPEKAFSRYTIFEELDKPFMGCRGGKGR